MYWCYSTLLSFLKFSINGFAAGYIHSCLTVNSYTPIFTGLSCRVDVIIFLLIRVTLESNLVTGSACESDNGQSLGSLIYAKTAGDPD